MVNSCPEASGPEEMNTVQIRYVHTPGVEQGEINGKFSVPPNLKPNSSTPKKP